MKKKIIIVIAGLTSSLVASYVAFVFPLVGICCACFVAINVAERFLKGATPTIAVMTDPKTGAFLGVSLPNGTIISGLKATDETLDLLLDSKKTFYKKA